MTPYIGQVLSFGFNFTPSGGFIPCDGRQLAISQYQALYALIGTTYGGDGIHNFGIPDLRGRVPIHAGQGPGLANYVLGQASGHETATITASQMPAHTHGTSQMGISVNSQASSDVTPVNNFLAVGPPLQYTASTGGSIAYPGFSATPLTLQGGSSPMSLLNPYLAINYCIATAGLYPQRS